MSKQRRRDVLVLKAVTAIAAFFENTTGAYSQATSSVNIGFSWCL